jgi:16S rRNA (cytidine1402-2'-O)-methyltransferase
MTDATSPPDGPPIAPFAAPGATASGISPLVARVAAEATRLLAQPLAPGLHLVATPIGNLGDVTLRALATLAAADVVYCEDTRHSRTLLAHYGITARLEAYHEHNGERERPRILARLAAGERVAVISDAGTPLVSDPGYKLVRAAIEAGHRVTSLPGPSAALAALTTSGLPTDAFLFAGFLPVREGARRARIGELSAVPATLVLFEAPTRLAACLADLAAVLGPRRAMVARELTKRFEESVDGTLADLATTFAQREARGDLRGEIAIVVAPPGVRAVTDADITAALAPALATMSVRDAAKAVATALAVPKSRVYDLAVRRREDEA